MKPSYILICFCFMISGCLIYPDNQRQVWLGGLQRTHAAQDNNVVRIYFDKWGNLYPDKEVFIPYKSFFNLQDKSNTYKEKMRTGNLQYYFTNNASTFQELASYYNVSTTAIDSENFAKIEKVITAKAVKQVNDLLKSSRSKTLVVFIHGFNDTDPTGDYQQLRDAINICDFAKGNDYIYLEIYWDGLTANGAAPTSMRIWGRAQTNSSNVSIGVREVLSGIEDDYKVRIISHSLGASVATGALFNTTSKWKHNDSYKREASHIPAPHQKDIRLGMIAPAIPGVSTFQDFRYRGADTITAKENTIHRIVLAINTQDYAVSKHKFGRDHAGSFGATNLGCDFHGEINKTRQELMNDLDYSASQVEELLQSVNFNNATGNAKEHGLYYYLLLETQTKDFLKRMFE